MSRLRRKEHISNDHVRDAVDLAFHTTQKLGRKLAAGAYLNGPDGLVSGLEARALLHGARQRLREDEAAAAARPRLGAVQGVIRQHVGPVNKRGMRNQHTVLVPTVYDTTVDNDADTDEEYGPSTSGREPRPPRVDDNPFPFGLGGRGLRVFSRKGHIFYPQL